MAKTIEELQAEAAEAQKALELAKMEADLALRNAKQEAEAVKARAKWELKCLEATRILEALLKALDMPGVTVEQPEGPWGLPRLKGMLVRVNVENIFSGWDRHSKGLRIRVEEPNTVRPVLYPQKADGSCNYEAAAKRIRSYLVAAKRKQEEKEEKEAALKTGEQLAKELCTELETSHIVASIYHRDPWRRGHGSEYVAPEGKVYLRLGDMTVTPEQARLVVKALRDVGLTV
jgi:hypothetical protein